MWLKRLSVINGIGPKADEKLQGLGIKTIGELAQKDVDWLIDHFGQKTGAWLFEAAHGRDFNPVVLESEPVSISRETTFERDLHAVRDKAELGAIFTRLCEQVAQDLQRKGYMGKTIGIKLRYDDFKSVTRDQTLNTLTNNTSTLRKTAGLCLKRVPLDRPLRLLGVRTAALSKTEDLQENTTNSSLPITKQGQYTTNSIAKEPQLF